MIIKFKVFGRTSRITVEEWCLASCNELGRDLWVFKTYKKKPMKEQIDKDIALINRTLSYHYEYVKPEKVTAKIADAEKRAMK